ncbi:hypothetical protein IJH26_00260 [Candidatus Saccharibacteria bacterium]|nr:hypothetical protein [Candidatus Saccharibacteria bacterium]MBQ3475936.1 hypothetical protein [Candidatus Saccharibacteria bacterium]
MYNRERASNSENQNDDLGFDTLAELPPFEYPRQLGQTHTRKMETSSIGIGSHLPVKTEVEHIPIRRELTKWEETFGDSVNSGEVAKASREFLNQIEDNKVMQWDIIEANRQNYREGSKKMAQYLAEILDIDMPVINYRISDGDGSFGSFNPEEYSITLYYDRKRSRKGSTNDLNTIAHEMWHAYQAILAIEGDTKRSQLYELNDRCYIAPEESVQGYAKQLMEAEAFRFGDGVERIFSASIKNGQDIVTKFLRLQKRLRK